ncbi:MAG: glycoside hydrolase family 1 protein [Patescibacteria group bacterium]|nr:glycoside hydrolase family 1 protein [Patescibacteria group bacterium]
MAKLKGIYPTLTGANRLKFHRTLYFPPRFLWGTATSAHQVEGGNRDNDWWAWEQRRKSRPHSGRACDHYRRYREDIALMSAMGQNAYRLSVEWSRIEPQPGQFNHRAIEHYRDVIRALNRAGIKPMVTLHHFTNPRWFAAAGGWTRRSSVRVYLRFVRTVIQELGDLVEFWVTINEPLVYSLQSYLVGLWPPNRKSYWLALRVYWHLVVAHRRAYREIHAYYHERRWHRPKVGFASNTVSLYAYQQHAISSWLFIRVADFIWNHSFIVMTGRGYHDFIAVNYYFHYRLKHIHFRTLRFFVEARQEHREMSGVGWEVYPQGIFDVLLDLRRYRLPIYITENGIATASETKRTRYLVSYLKEIYHAIQAGADVRGYFWWSLLDNFEWNLGFHPRFGLLGVNYRTQARIVRPAAAIYQQIAHGNSIPHWMLKVLGHGVTIPASRSLSAKGD